MSQSSQPTRGGRRPTPEDARLLVEIVNGTVAEQALEGMELLWTYDAAP